MLARPLSRPLVAPLGDPLRGCALPWESGGSSPWSPLLLAGDLIAWWDPRQLAGGAVSAWVDRKSAFTLSQGTGSSQPTVSTIGNTDGVLFDGTDDVLTGAAGVINGLVAFEAHANLIDTGTTVNPVIVEYGATGGNAAGGFSWLAGDGGGGNLGAFVTRTTLCDRQYAETLAAAATHGLVVDGAAAASIVALYKNGVSQSLTGTSVISPTNTMGNNSLSFGARAGGTLPWAGTIGDVVVTRALSSTSRSQLMSWLGGRLVA